MNKLFEKFGYCEIPKNTILFRGFKDGNYEDCMFFGTKYFVAKAFNNNVQVWRTKKSMKVLFLVNCLNNRGWVMSGLPELYSMIFPNEMNKTYTDLDIKQDINRRIPLVMKLMQDYSIPGWFSSVEDKIEVELCLFDFSNLDLIESSEHQDSKYFEDSLMKSKIYPSELFYDKTKQNIKSTYSDHRKAVQSWIKAEATSETEKTKMWHYCYNLRFRLKI